MKKILIIGGGSIGERHLRCFIATGRADVALCELNDTLREDVAGRYDLSQAYSSLTDALQDGFDAAVICTPAHLHIPMAMEITASNTAVLIEKPLSIAPNGIEDLVAQLHETQLASSVAYVLRHHPALRAMKDAVASGRFGQPIQAMLVGGQHFPFYRPAYRDIYYTKHETGGGAIQDALTHMINATEWIVGPVTRLVADAEHCVLEGVDVEDTVHLVTRHGSVLGSFMLNQHQPANETTLTVVCEKGMVRYEAHRARWMSCVEVEAEWKIEGEFTLERDDLFTAQADAFIDQLEGKAEAACSLTEAQQTLRVNLAALESVKTGQWIKL